MTMRKGLRRKSTRLRIIHEHTTTISSDNLDRQIENAVQQLVQRQRRSDRLFGNAIEHLQIRERLCD